jgi:tripartite-type tricarboxylate transporter receptor subunit TctC
MNLHQHGEFDRYRCFGQPFFRQPPINRPRNAEDGLMALARAVVAVAVALSAAMPACAQEYPTRLIRIVTSEVGAASDFTARVVAQGLTATMGQPAVVENHGGGVIAGELVARAAPNGHTLLVYGNTLWLLPLMRSQIPYNTQRDFAPLTLASRNSNVLVAHPSLPVRSVTELVKFAHARPGQLNYGSAAAGTTSHMGAELFKAVAKVDVVRVSFRGAGSALNALLSGQVQLMVMSGAVAVNQIKSGRVRALAVTSPDPSPVFPGVPTMAAEGLPGVEFFGMIGLFAPARTPPSIIALLNQEISRLLQRPEVKSRFMAVGSEVVGSTPDGLATAMRDEINRLDKVIRGAGIRDE